MTFLLDTNAIVGSTNGHRGLNDQLRHRRGAVVGISSIVAFELFFGAFKSSRPKHNLERVDGINFTVIPFERQDARQAGALRAALETAGSSIGGYDVLIAGQALARDLTLVTHNTRAFARVPGLRLEDWEG